MMVAAAACGRPAQPELAPVPAPAVPRVRPGIEVLIADSIHLVRGQRVGLLTNHTGVDGAGRRDVDVLRAAGVAVVALFSPEHGFRGTEDRPDLANSVDSATNLPIYSVYGGTRTPDLAGLDSIDVLLVDLQDVGARFYTYVSTGALMLRDAAARRVRVVVLDRPNPIGGVAVQGSVRDSTASVATFVGFLPLAMRHGLTMGEMLRLANDGLGVGADLVVVPAAGWRREMLYDATGLPWIRPSPNMPDLESALLYPGTCLAEGTNLSVGRGTPFAFQVVGAPWIDPAAVLRILADSARGPGPGVIAEAVAFTPHGATDGKFDNVALRGVRLRVTDRARFDAVRAGIALIAAVRAAHPDSFAFRNAWFDMLAAGPELRAAITAGTSAADIVRSFEPSLARFRERRLKYLLY